MTAYRQGIYTAVMPANGGYGGYVAFGKKTPFQTDPQALAFGAIEPGDLWFEFGKTAEEATAALLRDMGALT